MKTKTVDVWVSKDCIAYLKGERGWRRENLGIQRDKPTNDSVKVSITFEVPEEVIQISESQLKDAIRYYDKDNSPSSTLTLMRNLGFKNAR